MAIAKTATLAQLKNQARDNAPEFKAPPGFEKQVAHFRYGDGGAKITFAELLDEDFQPISEVEFDQLVFVRVYFEASTNSFNWPIQDEPLLSGKDAQGAALKTAESLT